jgi:hypothetical protein
MNLYTVHLRRYGLDPVRDMVLVREKFSWPAFFFGWLWALWHRLWLPALAIFLAELAVGAGMALAGADDVSAAAVAVGLRTVVGFVGNDLRRWSLGRRNFVAMGVVAAHDVESAEHRFLAAAPSVAAAMRV